MFRKFKESPYSKAAATIFITGALLILFNNWAEHAQFAIGFQNVSKTLRPIIIGIVCAFILCPVYNACVKGLYNLMLGNAKRRGFIMGRTIEAVDDSELPVDGARKRKILGFARALSSLICVLIVVGLVGLLIYFVVPQVIQNGITLASTLPERLEALSDWTNTHFTRFPTVIKTMDNIMNAGTSDILKWVEKHVLNGNAMNIATMISNGVFTAVKYVANAFIGLLIMVYLLNYKDRIFAGTRKIIAATFGQKKQDAIFEFGEIVNETFIGFIVGRLIDSFIIGVLTFIVLTICNIQFALMISVIVGVTNVIPFFGPFIGAIPSIFILMLENPMQALYFVIIILAIQQLDGNVIGPNIVGNAIGISSFGVLIAVLVGGGVFGFAGMALGVPVFAVCSRYVDKLTNRSLKKKEKPSSTQDYFNLDPYGIDDEEVLNEPEKKKSSIFHKKKSNPESAVDTAVIDDADYDTDADKAELRAFLESERESSKKPIGK